MGKKFERGDVVKVKDLDDIYLIIKRTKKKKSIYYKIADLKYADCTTSIYGNDLYRARLHKKYTCILGSRRADGYRFMVFVSPKGKKKIFVAGCHAFMSFKKAMRHWSQPTFIWGDDPLRRKLLNEWSLKEIKKLNKKAKDAC